MYTLTAEEIIAGDTIWLDDDPSSEIKRPYKVYSNYNCYANGNSRGIELLNPGIEVSGNAHGEVAFWSYFTSKEVALEDALHTLMCPSENTYEVSPGISSIPVILNADATLCRWFVNVYEVDRAYGGPEEGNWYYDTGEIMLITPCVNAVQAREAKALLEREYPHTGQESSVIYSGGSFRVVIEHSPGESYPKERPRYS